jgi:hypothetical protein
LLGGCNTIFGLAPTQLDQDGGTGAPDAIAGPDGAPPGRAGSVTVLSVAYQQGGSDVRGYGAVAAFGHLGPSCEKLVDVGGCVAVACTDVADPPPWPDSGIVFVETNMGAASVPPLSDGSYPDLAVPGTGLYGDGERVWFYSEGSEVPAFTRDLVAPFAIDFAQSALPTPSEQYPIDRATGLELSWSGGVSGDVTITITSAPSGSDGSSSFVECAFPAGAGAGTLAPEALMALPAGSASMRAIVVSRVTIPVGTYAVTLSAAVVARRADGDWVTGPVNLQ